MHKNAFNVRTQLNQYPVKSQLIAFSVLVALLSPLGTPVRAEVPVPVFAQAQSASETKPVAQRLLGQWQTKDPNSNEVIKFIFAPEDKLFIVLPAPSDPPVALGIKYQINSTPQLMELDMMFSAKESVLTVFEFTEDGKLRMELDGIEAGDARPNALTSEATVFEKISDATTLPENVQLIGLDTEK